MMHRGAHRPPEPPEPARTSLALRRQAHSPRTDQPGRGGLEAPESPGARAHHIDVLIVGAAEGEIGGGRVIVGDRHKTENEAARIDLDHTAETGYCHP